MRHITVTLTYEGTTGERWEVRHAVPLGNPRFDREEAERVVKRAIEHMFEKGPGRG